MVCTHNCYKNNYFFFILRNENKSQSALESIFGECMTITKKESLLTHCTLDCTFVSKQINTLMWNRTKKREKKWNTHQNATTTTITTKTTTNRYARSWNAHRSMCICTSVFSLVSQSVKLPTRALLGKMKKKTLVSSNELNILLLKHAHKNKC